MSNVVVERRPNESLKRLLRRFTNDVARLQLRKELIRRMRHNPRATKRKGMNR